MSDITGLLEQIGEIYSTIVRAETNDVKICSYTNKQTQPQKEKKKTRMTMTMTVMTISTKKMMQQQSPFKLSSLLSFVLVRVAVLSFLSPGLIFVPIVSAFSVSSPMIIGTRNHHSHNPININSRSRSNKHIIVLKAGLFGEQGSVYNTDNNNININYDNQIKNGTTYISSTSVRIRFLAFLVPTRMLQIKSNNTRQNINIYN